MAHELKDTTILKNQDIQDVCSVSRTTATKIKREIISLYKPKKVTYYWLKKYLFD